MTVSAGPRLAVAGSGAMGRLRAGVERLCRPGPLVGVGVLLMNDHLCKGAGVLPAWLTGKLSDVAGLAFFPVLLAIPLSALVRRHRGVCTLAVAATALVFIALKISPAFAGWASSTWGPIVADPSDLLALPALGLAWRFLAASDADIEDAAKPAELAPPWRARVRRTAVVAVATVAAVATPAPRFVRDYPRWQLDGRAAPLGDGCVDVAAWVAKSGKEGIGVTLRLTAPEARAIPGQRCRVAVERAVFEVEGRPVASASIPDVLEIEAGGGAHVYLAFAFDNNSLWNDGHRSGHLVLELAVADGKTAWRVPARHVLRGFYRHVNERPTSPQARQRPSRSPMHPSVPSPPDEGGW